MREEQAAAPFVKPVVKASRHPSGEDRLMLAREIEQVQLLIDVSREDWIARHPVGEFRMVERRVRMNGARHHDAVTPALSFPRRR